MAVVDVHAGHRLGSLVVLNYRIRIVMRFLREVLAAAALLVGLTALYIAAYFAILGELPPWR